MFQLVKCWIIGHDKELKHVEDGIVIHCKRCPWAAYHPD